MLQNLPLIVANFKANKTWDELSQWLEKVGPQAKDFLGTIIVCPSMAYVSEASQKIKSAGWQIKVAAQDISRFEQGSYTGEVAASQIKDQVSYCLIGHSERRQNFGEDDNALAAKAQNAKSAGIEPIFCVQGQNTPIPRGVQIVAYEPVSAIGTGNPDSPENVQKVAQIIKSKGDFTVLYGGSVTRDNAKSFIKPGTIDGILIGSSSLDPQTFLKIVETI